MEGWKLADLTPRQQRLLEMLRDDREPITGTRLAEACEVTRQVVVHDIAVLRAAGIDILSTPRGYWLQTSENTDVRPTHILAVCHRPDQTADELFTLVDHGITVLDVTVEHPLYGELHGSLHLSSRKDVEWFMQQCARSSATFLSSLTDGHHLHNIAYPSHQRLQEAIAELRRIGIQVFE